jgi:hypothetical protein
MEADHRLRPRADVDGMEQMERNSKLRHSKFQENSGGKAGEQADKSSSRGCVADNVGLTAE